MFFSKKEIKLYVYSLDEAPLGALYLNPISSNILKKGDICQQAKILIEIGVDVEMELHIPCYISLNKN